MKRFMGGALGLLCSVAIARADVIVPPLPTFPVPGIAGVSVPVPVAVPSLPLAPLPRVKGGAFDLRFVNVGQLVDLLYGDAMHVPHVISSDVLQDTRLTSFQYDGKNSDLHDFVGVFLDSLGFQVVTRDGVDFVSKKGDGEDTDPDRQTLVYRPRYRSAAYLAKLVQPLFTGRVNGMTDIPSPVSEGDVPGSAVLPAGTLGASGVQASGLPQKVKAKPLQSSVSAADELVFVGKASEVKSVKALLPELDTAPGEVVVRAWVYEVSNTNTKNSAFSIAAHVLGGQFSLSNGSTSSDATALQFAGGWLDAAISALNADTRFKEISDPHVRVLSGEQVSLNVGSQVPTLGSLSFQGATGTPVQSVDYQDAGVILNVEPTVMADAIQVKLEEQISSFVPTTTGVNNSPTKNTREMNTTVSLHDGEVIMLGGLVQDSNTSAVNREGWLPRFLGGRSSSRVRTEVLLVLQVQKV
jgi:hypothetical protein